MGQIMPYDRNCAHVESREHASPVIFGKALYALSLLFACLLMPVGAVLTFLSSDWR